mgnify:CR=1 FL=1
MKCLVTGSSGFIGNALVHRLCNQDHEVIGLTHKQDPPKKHPKATYITDDIVRPADKLKEACKTVDVVFHCAAFVKDYGSKKLFYEINVDGTKNLVNLCKDSINKFVFLSHIPYEKVTASNYYNKTKTIAETYLHEQYKKNGFPEVVIRPGNVYGPGATTWVVRPVQSIKKERIALIDHGSGIFLHTYIDNLLDALIAAAEKDNVVGKSIEVTDGDHSVTWGAYLNDLAKIVGKDPIKKNLSKSTALLVGKIMMVLHKIFGINPWVTPQAVETFTNTKKVSIDQAKKLLDYSPKISYEEGMNQVKQWLEKTNLNDS